MKRLDLVLDFETLGTNFNAPIFQVGAVVFDITCGQINGTFNAILYPDVNDYLFKEVSADTLKWWLRTNPDYLYSALNGEVAGAILCRTEEELINAFITYLNRVKREEGVYDTETYLWGNGIMFDNALLKQKCVDYRIPYPINYHNDRDIRTILELAANKLNVSVADFRKKCGTIPDSVQHNAVHDAEQEAVWVAEAYKVLLKKK